MKFLPVGVVAGAAMSLTLAASPVVAQQDIEQRIDDLEKQIEELKQVREASTTLLVSHRVSTARHADRILVLEKGRIIEMGTHEELLQAGGFYADLERAQRNSNVSAPQVAHAS